jgi:hypothetical protein
MLETLNRFLLFPFVVAFILGFLYYGLEKLVNPTKKESGKAIPDTPATTPEPPVGGS